MRAWLLLVPCAVITACSIADIPGTSGAGDDESAASAASTDGEEKSEAKKDKAAPVCVPAGTPTEQPPDWHTFPSCECKKGGEARCVPGDELPDGAKDKLADCSGGSCVPDTLLETRKLVACRSSKKVVGILIGEGRCLSMCVPDVADKSGLLDRGDDDECAPDERCAPCFDNSNDGKPTGLCDDAKVGDLLPPEPEPPPPTCVDDPAADAGAASDASTPPPAKAGPACCKGKGQCLAKSSLAEDGRWVLDRDGCESGELCAPLPTAAPTPCETNDYTGFCNDSCVIDEFFPRGSCASGQKCVPCLDDGDPTHVPGCP